MNLYRRAPGAVWRSLPIGIVVRRPGTTSEALTLTGAAAAIWLALDAPRAIEDIRRITTDAIAVFEMMSATGLVTVVDQLQ